MAEDFDFVVVGGGSAGAVIASRLSEDPSCRVALIEAGERPPEVSSMPVASAAMQRNPATDWMYTADPGKAGLGLNDRRVPVPRGKMLGGSSGIISGNTNAPTIMIGEKAAEMIAADHGVKLQKFVAKKLV